MMTIDHETLKGVKIFSTVPISLIDWLYLLLCPFLMVGIEEIRLAIKKGRKA